MKITINTGAHDIVLTDDIHNALNTFFRQLQPFPQKVFILTDENTFNHCFPLIAEQGEIDLLNITISSGEINKNLQTCNYIWKELLSKRADRNSLLINLGGGMISDIGGFIASTFMRGIKFINLPTSLLGMVDASSGGKTGVDLDQFKNMVGTFSFPAQVIIYERFLQTLPDKEWKNGLAEIIKHTLITDNNSWSELQSDFDGITNSINADFKKLISGRIESSINIKASLVKKDPFEKNERKFLNFGHTIGHALETLSLRRDGEPLSHGQAIAIGMICESYVSSKLCGLNIEEVKKICDIIKFISGSYNIQESDFEELILLMKSDKKSYNGVISMALLRGIGKPVLFDVESDEIIKESIRFYNRREK